MKTETSINHGTQPDAKPMLCSRCGSFGRNFIRSKVFLIFFCGMGKNIVIENQHFSYKFTNK